MEGVKQQFDIPLHDIKPIIDVHEYSLYYFIGGLSLVILLACGIIYLIYIWYKKRGAYNKRKHHAELLNSLDLSDTKNTAYLITNYAYTFKNDSPRHVEMFNNLSARLQEYKYKKNVEKFDDETLGYIELYKGMLDV